MSIHLQPPVPLVTLVKTELPTVIKNEPREEALEEEISTDVKEDINIVYHPLCEDFIKSETVLEDILENKHLESVQTQALVVKTENSPFIKIENINKRNKSEDTSDGNVSKGTGQGVVEVQASNEHSNALSNLYIDEQSVLNFSKDYLDSISVRSRKSKSPKKTHFAESYKTDDTTLWKKEKEKIKVIKAPVIPVEAHEYTSLAKGKHICNHCQQTCNTLSSLKRHIDKIHRKVTTMYQCPYCTYKSKWKQYYINQHIIQKHKDTKDIEWFQCNLCEMKFKLKKYLTQHMKVHLKHKQMQDGLDLREKASNEHYNALSNLETDEQSVFNFSEKSNGVRSKKFKSPEKTDFVECYKTNDTTLWEKEKEEIKVIKVPVIPIEAHEYISLAKDKHVCNHCQHACIKLNNLKLHIRKMHREVTTMYQCPYCPYRSKWKNHNIKQHIIQKHKDTKDIQWFQCHLCEKKFKVKKSLTEHKKIHLTHEQMQDGLDLKRHHILTYNSISQKEYNILSPICNHLKS